MFLFTYIYITLYSRFSYKGRKLFLLKVHPVLPALTALRVYNGILLKFVQQGAKKNRPQSWERSVVRWRLLYRKEFKGFLHTFVCRTAQH